MRKWIFAVLTIICAVGLMSFKSTYKKLWAQVEAAQEEGLPQTQKKWLTKILKKAEKDKELGEYFKAYVVYDDIVDTLGERSFEQSIDLLEQWLSKSSKEVEQAMIHQLLFQAYSTYYLQNTQHFYNRTAVTGNDTLTDIRFWTATQFKERIAHHLHSTFKNEDLLITKSSKDLSPFTTVNPFGKYFNHDLFHVLYWQSIKKIELLPLGDVDKEEMLVSLYDKALKLYDNSSEAQFLLRLHFIEKQNLFKVFQNSLVKADLDKEVFKELDNLIDEFHNTNVVVEAMYKKAMLLNMLDSTKLQAHQLCETAINNYSTYERIDAVKLLKQQIEKPLISLDALEHSYPGKKIVNSIDYRNVSELTISIYGLKDSSIIPHDTLLNQEFCNNSTYLINQLKIDTLSTSDYITHRLENIPLSIDKEGCYLIELTSPQAEKPDYAWFHSAKGQIIGRTIDSKTFEFIVVDGLSGHPIENAKITVEDNKKNKITELVSTSNGRAIWSIPSDYKQYAINVYVTKENTTLVPSVNFYLNNYSADKDKKELDYQGRLLTDRSIYRPGQSVHIKGYTYLRTTEGAKPTTNLKDTVSIYSPSGVILAEKEVVSNEFGTYSTLVDLPESALNGRYSIRTKRSRTTTSIQVEEYKRPTFAIELNPIEGRYKSGDTIIVSGKVEAFNKALLKGAVLKVDASVNNLSYPIYYREKFSKGKLVLFDKLNLADDGLFTVHIPLPEDDRYWSFLSLEVSVTSLSGETQKIDKGINYTKESFGLTSSFASILEKDQEIDLSVSAVNSDGQPVEVDGYYELFKAVDDEAGEIDNKSDLMLKQSFKANQLLLVDWSNLESGEYLLKCNGIDGEDIVEFTRRITLFSTTDPVVPVKNGAWLYVKKNTFNEENPALFNYGTADDSVYVYIDLFTEDGRLLKKERLHQKGMQFIEFPYKKEYGKGVAISLVYLKENSLKHHTLNLKYESSESDLKLKWNVFRNSLIPGAKEEWSLSVLDKDNQPVNAEVLAYMYDASLDQLRKKTNALNFAEYYFINTSYPNLGSTGFFRLNLPFTSDDIDAVPPLLYDEFDRWNRVNYEPPFYIRGLSSSKSSGMSNRVEVQSLDMSLPALAESQEEVFKGVSEKQEFIRDNFDETAFFYPHLRSNKEGHVTLTFSVPQQLTKWSFTALAHSLDMQVGSLFEEVLTEQDFSISLNTPRIIRQGDELTLNSILQNHKKTESDLEVSVTLTLFDPLTDKVISEESKAITIGAESEKMVSFDIKLNSDIESIGCRIVAENEEFSDGEQFSIPVLSNKVEVIDAKSLLFNDKTETKFDINSLLHKDKSNSKSGKMSLEISSNPLWFTIKPLVDASSTKTANSLTLANKVWATITANKIAEEYPLLKDSAYIAKVFNEYIESKENKRYQSISETPWAKEEIDRANQFNSFRELVCSSNLKFSINTMVADLLSQQQSNGGWSWYEGFDSNISITEEVLSVFDLVLAQEWYKNSAGIERAQLKALSFILSKNMDSTNKYKESITDSELRLFIHLQHNKQLYAGLESKEKEYIDGLKDRINKLSPKGSIAERALVALIYNKEGNHKSALRFVSSLKESLLFDKYGAHYNFAKQGIQWGSTHQIESHILAMKAIAEIEMDASIVNQMKLWLMHKVQTQSSFNAFTEKQVLDALLDHNSNLEADKSVVKIGKHELVLDSASPYLIKEIDLDTNQTLSIRKEGTSPLWVNLAVTYEENIEEVEQSADELSITKEYYVERVEGNNKTLVPLNDVSQLNLGDVVVSRLSFSIDTDLDFIHIQDDRSAVLEPVEYISGPRYRPLGCIGIRNMYQSITDKSTNYYFYKLQKGGYVVENRSYVVREGVVESGISILQSSLAPEFTAHSSSVKIIIK